MPWSGGPGASPVSPPYWEQLRSCHMKIVVIGGAGLIGLKLVPLLRERGQDVFAVAPNTGVNTITGDYERMCKRCDSCLRSIDPNDSF